MQCRCQFVQEKVCVSREEYAQVRKLVLGRLDNASPCVCVFSKNVCHEQYVHVSLVARHLQWTDAPPTPRHTKTHTHTHRQPRNHTPNHTDTPYHTPTYPNPPWWKTAGTRAGGKRFFFECRTRKVISRVEIRVFLRFVPMLCESRASRYP